jgi:hypothetical protein
MWERGTSWGWRQEGAHVSQAFWWQFVQVKSRHGDIPKSQAMFLLLEKLCLMKAFTVK